jgi:hypothetical protein
MPPKPLKKVLKLIKYFKDMRKIIKKKNGNYLLKTKK